MRRRQGEIYAVDMPVETLLVRIRQALEAGDPPLTAWAWRDYGTRDSQELERRRDRIDEEVDEIVKLGLIDIESTGKSEGWTLHLTVVDELGDHLPDDAEAAEGPEEIEMAEFWREFHRIGPDTVLAEVTAASGAAKQRFDAFLEGLEARFG